MMKKNLLIILLLATQFALASPLSDGALRLIQIRLRAFQTDLDSCIHQTHSHQQVHRGHQVSKKMIKDQA